MGFLSLDEELVYANAQDQRFHSDDHWPAASFFYMV
jgi:hypothetical protein